MATDFIVEMDHHWVKSRFEAAPYNGYETSFEECTYCQALQWIVWSGVPSESLIIDYALYRPGSTVAAKAKSLLCACDDLDVLPKHCECLR